MSRKSNKLLLTKTDLEKEFPGARVEYMKDCEEFVVTFPEGMTERDRGSAEQKMWDIIDKRYPMTDRDGYQPSVSVVVSNDTES